MAGRPWAGPGRRTSGSQGFAGPWPQARAQPLLQPAAPSSRKPTDTLRGPGQPPVYASLDPGIQDLAPADGKRGQKDMVLGQGWRSGNRVLTLHKLPAAWEDTAPFHCDPHTPFRPKGHAWDWAGRGSSPRVPFSWTDAGEWKPQGKERVWGPGRGWKKWRSVREPKSRGQGLPACSTWILTLEAGQIGILRFGFQQVWQPCIAVAEPTALGGGGQWEVSGAGQPFLPASHSHLPSSQAYPPEPHQDPVGLGPGPLLIGSQEAPHHGDAPVKARGGRCRVRLGVVP